MSNNYALLIGVNDYSAYDASRKQAKGTSDLKGSLNDVRAWWRLCRELGYAAENIRVLTSPALPHQELEGSHTGAATAEAIREGVTWLADKLGADQAAGGVLTFSGHGDLTGQGLVLCSTDTIAKGDDLEGVVELLKIQALIAERGAGHNLTVALDCCHSGAGGDNKRRALALRADGAGRAPSGAPPSLPSLGGRTFFAAERGQAAYQAELGGRVHGAFTWALMTTKEQWTIVGSGGDRELTISNENMRSRAQALLDALSFGQTPALRCPPAARQEAMFHKGSSETPCETSEAPDATRTKNQCDPGTKDYRVYTIKQYNSSTWGYAVVGYMVVPRVNSGTGSYLAGYEYWYMVSNTQNLATNQNLYFSWADYTWSGTPSPPIGGLTTLSFKMPQNASWAWGTPPKQQESYLFCQNGQGCVSLLWNMTTTNGVWSGSVTWWSPTGANNVFDGLPTSYTYLYANMAPSSTWYYATVRPS